MDSMAIETLGIIAITAMVVFYALENNSRIFILLFSVACALSAIYAWLIGSYPFLIAESIWAVIAARRWYRHPGTQAIN